jgi:hypothetical protein
MKNRSIQILFQIVLALLFTGCAAPKLIVESNVYSFPDAVIGESVSKEIKIENKGTSTLKISNVKVSGERYSQKKTYQEILIPPNQKYVLDILFSPDESGNYSGILSIASNDPANKIMNLQLQGKGIKPRFPEIKVLTSALDFLRVDKDSIQKKTITISNTGEATLVISNLAVSGEQFSIEGVNQNKLSIYPDQSLSLNVQFKPAKPGSYSGILNIFSNDLKNKIVSVSLKGEGFEKIKNDTRTSGTTQTVRQPIKPDDKQNNSDEPVVIPPEPPRKPIGKSSNLGVFTHDEVQGTMKIQEGTMQKNSEKSFSFEVQKTGDFEILITPGYDLVSTDFRFTDISTFTDKSRYKRFIKEKVQPNSSFQVVIKRKDNSPDNYKFIFKLFPR